LITRAAGLVVQSITICRPPEPSAPQSSPPFRVVEDLFLVTKRMIVEAVAQCAPVKRNGAGEESGKRAIHHCVESAKALVIICPASVHGVNHAIPDLTWLRKHFTDIHTHGYALAIRLLGRTHRQSLATFRCSQPCTGRRCAHSLQMRCT